MALASTRACFAHLRAPSREMRQRSEVVPRESGQRSGGAHGGGRVSVCVRRGDSGWPKSTIARQCYWRGHITRGVRSTHRKCGLPPTITFGASKTSRRPCRIRTVPNTTILGDRQGELCENASCGWHCTLLIETAPYARRSGAQGRIDAARRSRCPRATTRQEGGGVDERVPVAVIGHHYATPSPSSTQV